MPGQMLPVDGRWEPTAVPISGPQLFPGWGDSTAAGSIARIALLLAALLCAPMAHAQDPLDAETFTAAWAWKEVLWVSDTGRSDYWGGRVVAQLGVGHWGIAVRGDVGGLPERFDLNNPGTFQSASGYLAAHVNLYGQRGLVVGPTVLVGKALRLERGPTQTQGRFTAGAGVRIAGGGGVGYLALGTHEALGGFCAVAATQLPLTSRLSVMADGAVGTDGRAYVRLGMAVTLAKGGQ